MKKLLINKTILPIFLAILLLSSCTTLPPLDPKYSGQLHEEAIRATSLKNYAIAVEKYNEAIRYNPQEAQLYLQLAEVQEALQQFIEASKTYQLALKRLPINYPERQLIHYRLGLLHSRSKSKLRNAKRNLALVTEKSMRLDLEGMITLNEGDPDASLRLFSLALQAESDSEQKARIYYHAALAHFARGASVDSSNALFNAVNNARSLALTQHIRIFFDQLQSTR